MKKVLILGVSEVQADAIRILKEMGIETYACSKSDDGPGSKEADNYEILDFTYIDKVIDYIKNNQIDCVYSVGSDIATRIYSEISEKINLPGFVSGETARICNNKNEMRAFLGKDFKGNLNYQVLDNKYEDIYLNFPFIMKPADSQGQRGVQLIHNEVDFKEKFMVSKNYSRSGFVIIEEYISGPELSVNVYMIDGKIALLVPSDRVCWQQFQGGLIHKHIVPSKIINKELEFELLELVERVSKKLNIYNGPMYFQIKLLENKPIIIEVTPRLDGCHMWKVLLHYTGVNIIKLLFEHLLYNNTSEIRNYKKSKDRYMLEFLCAYPNSKVDYGKYKVPENSLCYSTYYKEDQIVRPINNRFEKIGYFITKNT
ncbi:MAG: acetyl-CoA carboxylase biotin carboxylase subunit family protein [Pedobacter sp.]